jgi:pimeloyl-ACP methyl ester carboxylesterase
MVRLDSNRWVSTRIFGLAQRARPDLVQVARYLTDDVLRTQIQARVEHLFDNDLCLVIAHSLGSIVGWEVCRKIEESLPMLLTIGSPLGIGTVVYPRLRPTPPVFPPSVRRWVNVAHPDDIIAVEPRLARFFPSPDSRRVEDHCPISQREHHNAITYLEQPVVGQAVAEVLTAQG